MSSADLILENANVITLDKRQPTACGVAVKGNRILAAAATRDELEALAGPDTKVIDCTGKTIVPGFIDAHCHLFSLMWQLSSVDLSPSAVKSIGDIMEALHRQAEATKQGHWITGSGFNEFYLDEKRMPTRTDLDAAVPDRPALVVHRSLHICVVNSKALELAGIRNDTPEPPGARFGRDLSTGEPNGILYEMLGYLREKVMPPPSAAELADGMRQVSLHNLRLGITSINDASSVNDHARWVTLQKEQRSGHLKTRVRMMIGFDALRQFDQAGFRFGDGDDWLRLGSVKIVLHQATGQLYPSPEELEQMTAFGHDAGYQVAVHAVDEQEVETVIAAYESVGKAGVARRRHRIEHCSECPPHLLERLRQLQPVIVTQPPFVYHSGDRYLATVAPERQSSLYRIKSLLESGLVVAGSSDGPVVPSNPLDGIYASVTRRTQSGQELPGNEGLSVMQALHLYTLNAAYSSCEESDKGSINPGKLADMVVLSGDPLRTHPEQLRDIRVEMTILDGQVAW